MAAATVVSTAETAVATAGTSHAITLPAGIVSTDLVLITMDIGSTSATLNALAGWTEILDEAVANGLKILQYTGAGVPTTPTFVSSAATRSASIAWRISGADKTVTPQIGTTSTGTSLTPDPPASATPPSSKDYLFIAIAGMAGEEADDDTWANTPPTNYTPSPPLQIACGIAGTNLGGLLTAASRALTTGAAENPGTFGVDVSAAWRAQTITVHPAPPPALSGAAATSSGTVSAATTQKGAQGAASTVTGARSVALGGKPRPASTSTGAQSVAAGRKAASGVASTSARPQSVAVGQEGARIAASTSTAAPRSVAAGQKGSANATIVSAGARSVAAGRKGAQSPISTSTAARSTALGQEGGQGVVSTSTGATSTAQGQKAARGVAATSDSTRSAAVGTAGAVIETHSGAAGAAAGAASTAQGQKGAYGAAGTVTGVSAVAHTVGAPPPISASAYLTLAGSSGALRLDRSLTSSELDVDDSEVELAGSTGILSLDG